MPELTTVQIQNTLYFLGQVELKGQSPEILMEMALLLKLYKDMLQPPSDLPAVDGDKPNRAQRREAAKGRS